MWTSENAPSRLSPVNRGAGAQRTGRGVVRSSGQSESRTEACSFPGLTKSSTKYVQSRTRLSEHLRSNLCEDAVGLSSCQNSENPSSRCVLHGLRVQRGPSEPSAKGTSDGPSTAYPLARPPGRGSERALLPNRRRLRPPQPPRRSQLRVHKAAFGLGSDRPRSLPAAARRAQRTFFLAGCPAVLLTPVSGGGKAPPFLLQPAGEEAQALFGAAAAGHTPRVGRRAGDVAHRLDVAGSPPSAPGFSVGRLGKLFGGSRMGKVGLLLGLRSETAPVVRHQPGAPLLRTHSGKRSGHLPERRTHQRDGFGRGGSEEALGRLGLPKRGFEGGSGRGGHPLGDRASRTAARSEATN